MVPCSKGTTQLAGRSDGRKPPMNSRQRGKYYRARLKLHHSRLLRHVAKLRKQLTDLKLLAALQSQLAHSPISVRHSVMKCLRDLLDENVATPSLQTPLLAEVDRSDSQESSFHFTIHSFLLQGPREAPVLVLRGSMRGKLPPGTINRLYCCLPGNTRLLNALVDREVTFASTRSIFFGCDGSVRSQLVETDYSATMAALAPNLRGLSCLLQELGTVENEIILKTETV